MLPSQLNFVESNLACEALPPSSGSIATPRPTMRDLSAVPRRHVEHVVREVERTRTRPVRRNDDRIARQVSRQMPRQQPAVGVVTETGRREADQEPDLLPCKRHRRAGLRLRCRDRSRHQQRREHAGDEPHGARLHSAFVTRSANRRVGPARAETTGGDARAYSAARSIRIASRCAITSSTCMTSTYL